MKLNIISGTLSLILIIFLFSCKDNQKSIQIKTGNAENEQAKVVEVIQASAYTYLKVEKNNREEWIAINKQDIKTGAIIYYEQGLKMENFTSPELKRTFETVYFVNEISESPLSKKMPGEFMGDQPMKPVLNRIEGLNIDKPENGVTIRDLYAKREELSGKNVLVKGKVTKVNLAIMERNWIHIQDGTTDGNNFDLTITTSHEPKVGDIITYSGKLSLNRDFGSGYTYELILEEATPLESY